MIPESHPVAFDVDVCDTVSVFTQVTVPPTATLTSSGMKALSFKNSALIGIVTFTDDGPGAGVGVGVGAGVATGTGVGAGVADGEVGGDTASLPQATATMRKPETARIRNEYI